MTRRLSDQDDPSLSGMINDIYDSIFDFEKWGDLIDKIYNRCPGSLVALHGHDVDRRETLGILQRGFEAAFVESYYAYYARLNPYMTEKLFDAKRQIFTAPDVVDIDDLLKSTFYNEWLRPQQDAPAWVALVLSISGARVASLCVNLPLVEEDTRQDEIVTLLGRLRGPMLFAIDVRRRFGSDKPVNGIGASLVEDMPTGIAVIGPNSAIRFMNTSFERIISRADGLTYQAEHGLDALDRSTQRRLSEAIGCAVAGEPSQPVPIKRMSGIIPYVLIALPGDGKGDLQELRRLLGADDDHVVLLVVDPADRPVPRMQVLQSVFGLTAAEAKLSTALGAGADLAGYAAENALSRFTARNQLAAAMRKLGIRKQSELIRILSGLDVIAHVDDKRME